jgi:hypothetical protein
LKLLNSGRDIGEAREEDIYNRDRVQWDGLIGQRISIVPNGHCGMSCTWTARQYINGKIDKLV